MDAQTLTDADFAGADAPSAGTDAGTNPDNFGGYPDWDGAASLPPEDATPSVAVSDQPPATDLPDAPDQPITVEAETPEAGESPEAEAETPAQADESERVAKLERELAAERERIAQFEAAQRQQARIVLDRRAAWEEEQIDARLDQEWAEKVVPQAQRLQGAAQASFLNASRANFNRARDQQKAQVAEIHRNGVLQLLANDPQTRHDFYSQVLEQHGLPEEARVLLAHVDPEAVDDLVPQLQAEYARAAARERENDQLRRELEVLKRARSGADAMGGAHRAAVPASPLSALNDADAAYAAYSQLGGFGRAR